MAAWPAELPPPAINTLRESPPDNAIRTPMDKGPAKVRRRTTANTRPLTFEMNLLPEEVEILDGFYEVDVYSGTEQFDFTHPRTGAGVQARFVERPTYAEREGTDYRATVSLEILP